MSEAPRDRRYRRKLLFLLSSATFFEGYDTYVLSFVLALVLVDLGGTEAGAGWIRAIVGLGAAIGFLRSRSRSRPPSSRRCLLRIARRPPPGITAGSSRVRGGDGGERS